MSKPRQRFLILSIVALVFVSACFFGYILYRRHIKRNSAPVIMCSSDVIRVSVTASEEDLLVGVTAMDAEDGDLTSKIVIERISPFTAPGKCTITYAVCDSGNKVSSVSRTLYYTDYHPPRFILTSDLTYASGTTLKLKDCIKATDCFDEDISNRISWVEVDEDEVGTTDSKEVEFSVINSRGDSATFRAYIVVQEHSSTNTPEIRLGLPDDEETPYPYQYLIYVRKGEMFDPLDYVKEIRLLGTTYTAEEFLRAFGSGAITADFDPAKDELPTGVNRITIFCEYEGHIGSTILYVIVEE